ncbi:hypothetical protein H4R20_007134, partial [Coemansia guatemalensis]
PDSSDEEGYAAIANTVTDSASSDESDANGAIIDLSSRRDTPVKSVGQSSTRLPAAAADSHAVDVTGAPSGTAGSSFEDHTPLDGSSRPLGRFSSPWSEAGMSWLARIKSSYRSLDRSLIYDLDKHYIQPLLIRQDPADLTSSSYRPRRTNRRRRPRPHSFRDSDADDDDGDEPNAASSRMRGSSSRAYRTHLDRSAVEQQAVTDTWASFRPEVPNWGSDTSDNTPSGKSAYPERPLLG